jgi:UDP-N-acetylmuramate dehydrogenase
MHLFKMSQGHSFKMSQCHSKVQSVESNVLLADHTTLHVGGPAAHFLAARSEEEITSAIAAADAAGEPVLVIGTGSNMVISDAGFPGLVVHDARSEIPPSFTPAPASKDDGDYVLVTAVAGRIWDQLVADTVAAGLAGIEAMSGIPGTVGAAPVQNVGAYGQDVSMTLFAVRVWDRFQNQVRNLTAADMQMAYRNSLLKRSMHDHSADDYKSPWQPSPRYVVLELNLRLLRSEVSKPIQWEELGNNLGVGLGGQAPLAEVRAEVLRLRDKRGTLIDGYGDAPLGNHDRWSVGSFFTNPIVSKAEADLLPDSMPKFPLGEHEVGDASANKMQIPAAWLIENSGFPKGFGLHGPESQATVSNLHCLALTNRGGATAADIVELARAVRAGVQEKWALTLVPEPNQIGLEI